LLGGFRLESGGQALTLRPGSQRLVALLATLGPMSRAAAARLMWPDAGEPQAHSRMRTALWRLGSEVPVVELSEQRLMIVPDMTVDLVTRVAAAVRLIEGRPRGRRDAELLVNSVGELLPGWYDEWVLVEREQFQQLRLRALETLAELDCECGRYATAVDAALAAMRLEPLRESAHYTLIRAYLGEQNLVEAARHYRTLRCLLDSELGIEPATRVTALLAAHGLAE
jgi:DNA-binding SARP family transcriptional activator